MPSTNDTMNAAATYKVIFSGAVLPGQSASDVATRFSQAFKLSNPKTIARLFSGKVITLKSGLDETQAQRYKTVLEKLGADCLIEREQTSSFVAEIDQAYERKKRRRVAQFDKQQFDDLELAPK